MDMVALLGMVGAVVSRICRTRAPDYPMILIASVLKIGLGLPGSISSIASLGITKPQSLSPKLQILEPKLYIRADVKGCRGSKKDCIALP